MSSLAKILFSVLGVCVQLSYGQEGIPDPQSFQEVWRVGAPNDEVLFGEIQDIAVDSKGRVHVVDWSHPSVYIFSGSDGKYIREVGAKGDGPGEFRQIAGIAVGEGDSLFVFDNKTNRISLFSTEKYDFSGSLRVEYGGNSYPNSLIGVLPDAFILSYVPGFQDGADIEETRLQEAYLIDRRTGARKKPFPIVSIKNLGIMVHAPGDGSYAMTAFPFRVTPHMYVSRQGRMYFSRGDNNAVAVYSEDGIWEDSLRWSHDLVPITSNELRNALRKRSRRWRRVMRDIGLPEFKPAIQNLVVDDEEQIWVQLSAQEVESTATCLILDTGGNLVNSLKLPVNLHLEVIRNGKVYGVLRAEDGSDLLIAYNVL